MIIMSAHVGTTVAGKVNLAEPQVPLIDSLWHAGEDFTGHWQYGVEQHSAHEQENQWEH